MKWIPAALVLTFCILPVPTLAQIPQTAAERSEIVKHLPWSDGGTFHLDESKSTLTADRRFKVITGPAVARFWEATQGVSLTKPIEAVVVNPDTGDFVTFERVTEGFVRFDDWHDVNPEEYLNSVKRGTAEANKRRASGMSPIEVIGWSEEPALDRTTQTAHWAIKADDGGTIILNASTLVFGRFGYEHLTWVGNAEHDSAAFLTEMRQSLRFDPGAQYADYRPGDKTAAYGVAGLVAALIGAKVAAKIGLLAILLGILKKAAILLVVAFGGLLSLLKRIFTGRASIEDPKRL